MNIPTAALAAPASMPLPAGPIRLRHTLRLRRLRVLSVQRPTLNFVRVRLGGDGLDDFPSAAFDDHVKLMLPAPGAALVLPTPGPDGPSFPPGAQRPLLRDYTPRSFDRAAGTLDVELALHGPGVAAQWAAQAQPGMEVGVGGPRSSFLRPWVGDRELLIGDDSALPAIARRLEETPAGRSVQVIVQTADPADRRDFTSAAHVDVTWLDGNDSDALAQALRRLVLPAGPGWAWAAGEATAMAQLRKLMLEVHGLDQHSLHVAAYWKRGVADHHENL